MPVSERWAYFDHAAVAPLPRVAHDAISRWLTEAVESGDVAWTRWAGELEELRKKAARLIGAHTDEIALVRNTSHGISIVAEAFPWQPGDNVVIPADEFPANQYPWLAVQERGVEVRRIPPRNGRVQLDDLAAACDSRTRIVSVSWVSYHLGWRHDPAELAALAHRHGAYLVLDAIQGLGAFPINVHEAGVDFLAADGHKWLLGPEGAGIFFIRRPLWEMLRPTNLGWNSVESPLDFEKIDFKLKDSAGRYEGGSANMVGFIGLNASLGLLLSFGVENIAARILEITGQLVDRLRHNGFRVASERSQLQHASGILAVEWPHPNVGVLRPKLLECGVVASVRAGYLRLSPHAYNDSSDLDRLIEALKSLRGNWR